MTQDTLHGRPWEDLDTSAIPTPTTCKELLDVIRDQRECTPQPLEALTLADRVEVVLALLDTALMGRENEFNAAYVLGLIRRALGHT